MAYTLTDFTKLNPNYAKRYNPQTNTAYVSNAQTGKEISFGQGQGQQYGLGAVQNGSHLINDPGKLIAALSGPISPSGSRPSPVAENKQTYQSPYADKIGQTLAAIQNRPSFNYNPSADVGLKSAQTSAVDAVSRAAARRGMLYSDSNKSQMGQSAMALVPQFQQQALNQYNQEGQTLADQLRLLSDLEGDSYSKYRDDFTDQRSERIRLEDRKYEEESPGYKMDNLSLQSQEQKQLIMQKYLNGEPLTEQEQRILNVYQGSQDIFEEGIYRKLLNGEPLTMNEQKVLGVYDDQSAKERVIENIFTKIESGQPITTTEQQLIGTYREPKVAAEPKPVDRGRETENLIWEKYNSGKTLTADERDIIGLKNSSMDMNEEVSALAGAIRSGQITPGQALKQIEEDLALGLYTPEQAKTLTGNVKTLTKSEPAQTTTEAPQQTDNQLVQMWYTDPTGQKAGTPKYDWVTWNKDPNGRSGGLSFEQWRKLYGPQITNG